MMVTLTGNVGSINDKLILIPRVHYVNFKKLVCAEKILSTLFFVIVNQCYSG